MTEDGPCPPCSAPPGGSRSLDRAVHEQGRAAAGIIVDTLAAMGIEHAVLSPGSRHTPLALALEAHSGLAVHVVLDERSAAFVALGIGRASGRPAALCCTSGSAAAHYLPAFVEASEARVPMVALTADRPPEKHGCGAPQTTPQHQLLSSHARLCVTLPVADELVSPRWLRNTVCRAVAESVGSPPGPVHLDVPFREPLYLPRLEALPAPWVPHPDLVRGTARLDDDALEVLAARLAAECAGVLVCGPRAPGGGLPWAVARLARALGWVVLADPASGLRFGPHDRSNVVANADVILRDPGVAHALRPGRAVCVGQLPTSQALQRWLGEWATDRVTLVDPDGWWLDGGGVARELVIADPTRLCEGLADRLEGHAPGKAAAGYAEAWRRAGDIVAQVLEQDRDAQAWEGAIAGIAVRALRDGGQLHVGNSMPIRDLDAFAGTGPAPIAVHANRGCNGIDGTVSTALGEALSCPSQPTLALVGDLAWLHDLSGVEAAAMLDARLTVVVVDNGGGGIFGQLPIAAHPTAFERLFLTPRRPSVAGICRALGIVHERVNTTGELAAALERSLARPGLGVVEVPVDRNASDARRRRLLDAVTRALAASLDGLVAAAGTPPAPSDRPRAPRPRSAAGPGETGGSGRRPGSDPTTTPLEDIP